MKPVLYYCYDAYCGWCYGFSPVIKKIAEEYRDRVDTETLSGGMIPESAKYPIGNIAGYIQGAYQNVEGMTGIKFGEDFLWHIHHPDLSDWVLNSEVPARAMCAFKDWHPDDTIAFASEPRASSLASCANLSSMKALSFGFACASAVATSHMGDFTGSAGRTKLFTGDACGFSTVESPCRS